jgi:DNA-binding response OmpR family regulator/HPt (histidine-containing phosphotransfer) domain-containing protein
MIAILELRTKKLYDQSMKILIASAHTQECSEVTELCHQMHLETSTVHTIEELMDQWPQNDLMICLENLSNLSGLKAIAQIRACQDGEQFPIILIAPGDDFDVLTQAAKLNLKEVFDPEEVNKLKNALARHAEKQAALAGLEGHVLLWNTQDGTPQLLEPFKALGLKITFVETRETFEQKWIHEVYDLAAIEEENAQQDILDCVYFLKKYHPQKQGFPILLASACADNMRRATALRVGFADTLNLPMQSVELATKLGVHLRNEALMRQLQKQTQSIRSMFHALNLGICTFGEDYKIDPEYSPTMSILFEQENLVGENLLQLIKNKSLNHQETLDRLANVLCVCLGMDTLNWDLNNDEFPKELELQSSRGSRIVELEWIPVAHEEIVHHILLIMRDVTEVRALEKARHIQDLEQELLSAALKHGLVALEITLQKAMEFSFMMPETLAEGSPEIMRALHTLKGNARSLGLSHLSHTVHLMESAIVQKQAIDDHFDALQNDISANLDLLMRLQSLQGPREKLTLGTMMDQLFQSLVPISQAKGIQAPKCLFSGPRNETLALKQQSVLQDCLNHLLRNAIAHGFESAPERVERGWPAKGTLSIHAQFINKELHVQIEDDGKGLNIKRLHEIALSQGHNPQTDEETAEWIFKSGISTAQTIDELSGRGIGLDAVRATARQANGDLLFSLKEVTLPNHRRISFELILPWEN